MSKQYINELNRGVTAQICQTIGYNATQATPLELLHDALHKFLQEFARDLRRQVEHYNRTQANLNDCMLTLNNLNINVSELFDYVNNVQPVLPSNEVSIFPVPKESNLNFLKPGSQEVLTRPMHIYEYFPPILPTEHNDLLAAGRTALTGSGAAKPNYEKNRTEHQLADEDTENVAASAAVANRNDSIVSQICNSIGGKRIGLDSSPLQSPGVCVGGSAAAAAAAAASIRFDEEGRPTREIQSVMMTIGGYISPAIEGKLAEVLIPDIIEKLKGLDAPPSPAIAALALRPALAGIAPENGPSKHDLTNPSTKNPSTDFEIALQNASPLAIKAESALSDVKITKSVKHLTSMNSTGATSSSVVSKLLKRARKKPPGNGNFGSLASNLSNKLQKINTLGKMNAATDEKAQRKLMKLYQKLSKSSKTPAGKNAMLAGPSALGDTAELLAAAAGTVAVGNIATQAEKSGGKGLGASQAKMTKQMKKQDKHRQKKLRQVKELLELNRNAAEEAANESKLLHSSTAAHIENDSRGAVAANAQGYLAAAGAHSLQPDGSAIAEDRGRESPTLKSSFEIKLSTEPDRSKLNIFKKISKQKSKTQSPLSGQAAGSGNGRGDNQVINLPSGTTITPAPPQSAFGSRPFAGSLPVGDAVVVAVAENKPKKRGRKPGSKNQPKLNGVDVKDREAQMASSAALLAAGTYSAGMPMVSKKSPLQKKSKKQKGGKMPQQLPADGGMSFNLLQPTNLSIARKDSPFNRFEPIGAPQFGNTAVGESSGFYVSPVSADAGGGSRASSDTGKKMKNKSYTAGSAATMNMERFMKKPIDESQATSPSKEEVHSINRKLMRMDTTLKPLAGMADNSEKLATLPPLTTSPSSGTIKKRALKQFGKTAGTFLPPSVMPMTGVAAASGALASLPSQMLSMFYPFQPRPGLIPQPGIFSANPAVGMMLPGFLPFANANANATLTATTADVDLTDRAGAENAEGIERNYCNVAPLVPDSMKLSMIAKSAGGGMAKHIPLGSGGNPRSSMTRPAEDSHYSNFPVIEQKKDAAPEASQILSADEPIEVSDDSLDAPLDATRASMPATPSLIPVPPNLNKTKLAQHPGAMPMNYMKPQPIANVKPYFASNESLLTGSSGSGVTINLAENNNGADKSPLSKKSKRMGKTTKRPMAAADTIFGIGGAVGGAGLGVGKLAGGADLIPLTANTVVGTSKSCGFADIPLYASKDVGNIYLNSSTSSQSAVLSTSIAPPPPHSVMSTLNQFPDLNVNAISGSVAIGSSHTQPHQNLFDSLAAGSNAETVSAQQQQMQLLKLKHKEHKMWKKVMKDGRIKKKKDKKDRTKHKEYYNEKYVQQQQQQLHMQKKLTGKALTKHQKTYGKYDLAGDDNLPIQKNTKDKELLKKLKKEKKKEKHRQLSNAKPDSIAPITASHHYLATAAGFNISKSAPLALPQSGGPRTLNSASNISGGCNANVDADDNYVASSAAPPTPPLPKLTLRFNSHSRSNSQSPKPPQLTEPIVAPKVELTPSPSEKQALLGTSVNASTASSAMLQNLTTDDFTTAKRKSSLDKRDPSPELAKISPLVTRPPKQKLLASNTLDVPPVSHSALNTLAINEGGALVSDSSLMDSSKHVLLGSSDTASASGSGMKIEAQHSQSMGIVPPPNPWLAGGTLTASSVLLPQQLFQTVASAAASSSNSASGSANVSTKAKHDEPPTQKQQSGSADNFNALSEAAASSNSAAADSARDTILVPEANRPSSYIDAEGNRVWICPACGKVDDGSPMIGCDGCDAWYHWVCVGIFIAPKDNEDWFCRVCIMRKKGLHIDKKRKRSKKK